MPGKTNDFGNKNMELSKKDVNSTASKDFANNVVSKHKTNTTKSPSRRTVSTGKSNIEKRTSTKKTTPKMNYVSKNTTSSKLENTKKTTTSRSSNSRKTNTSKNPKFNRKSAVRKNTTSSRKIPDKKNNVVEYYDLPYRYNQTMVKLLAQTPTNLFIYWDISDEDRENYKKQYGENFFETTKPVLKIYNDTMHYNFEVEINDFANSWYLHVNDSKCDYRVELGRRPINNTTNIPVEYIHISTSNKIESPNDKILFNKAQNMIYYRNVKTNSTKAQSVATLSFIRNMGKIYNIYDLYKEVYKEEEFEEFYNPSSKFI